MTPATKHKPYPAYKPSGVAWLGDVPSTWPVARLRFQVKTNPVKSEIRGLSEDTSVSFVPMEAVGEYGGLRLEQTRPLEEVTAGYTYFRDGDVVVAKITPCFENGKGSIADGLENGIAFGTTELHVLRPSPLMDRKYLFYLSISHAFRQIGASYMYGAGGQKRVPDDFIRDFRHPLPTISEQRTIAAFLDRETARIDALIEKKQRQIELLQEKRAAIISHAVTKGLNPKARMKDSGIEWLGKVPEHWEVKKLGLISTSLQTGPFGSQLHSSDYVDDGIPIINPANIQNGEIVPDNQCTVDGATFQRLSRHRLFEGDIVFARRGEMGRCALVTAESDGFLCGTGSLRVELNKRLVDPHFISLFLSTAGVKDHLLLESVGSTMDNLNTGILARIPIAVPPLEEQETIRRYVASSLQQIGSTAGRISDSIVMLREYRTALISATVTGKMDVQSIEKNGTMTGKDCIRCAGRRP